MSVRWPCCVSSVGRCSVQTLIAVHLRWRKRMAVGQGGIPSELEVSLTTHRGRGSGVQRRILWSVSLSAFLCVDLSLCLLACLSVYLSVHLSTCSSVCLFIHLSIHLSIPPFALPVHVYICLLSLYCMSTYMYALLLFVA